jgi:hypothetical protein
MTDPGTKMTLKRITQTAIGSFLVPQTVEERRQAFQSGSKILPDMSALPLLKQRKKTQPCRRMMQKVPGKVNNIAKSFEKQQSATKTMLGPVHRLNNDNNTTLFRHITGSTELGNTCRDPEMAL